MTDVHDALELSELVVERGNSTVLKGVTLRAAPGQITALLGPNGAGKSSLVLTVGGVLKAASGSIKLGDQVLSGLRPEAVRKAGVAIVPEGRRLFRDMTVRENLELAGQVLRRSERDAAFADAVELFPELEKRMNNFAGSLSGGEQQMVVLAQAMLSRPRFLLVDELSLGLAPLVVKRLVPRLAAVAESGTGVLLVEQFASIALEVSVSAYVLAQGEITLSAQADAIAEDPDRLREAYRLVGAPS